MTLRISKRLRAFFGFLATKNTIDETAFSVFAYTHIHAGFSVKMRQYLFTVLHCKLIESNLLKNGCNHQSRMAFLWIVLITSLVGSNGSGERSTAKHWGNKSMSSIRTATNEIENQFNPSIPVGWNVITTDAESTDFDFESIQTDSPQEPQNERVTLADAF